MGGATPKSQAEPARQERSPLFTARWVLVSDIDNTLLGDHGALGDLLGWIQHRTGKVAFGVATGRTLASTLRVLREWKVPVPDFLITAVGSEIHYGPKLRRDEKWRECLRRGWRRESLARALRGVPGLRLQERAHQREFKLSYLCDPARMPPLSEIQGKLDRLGLSFNLIHSHGEFLDVLPARASKGHAIRYLATQWDLSLKQFLVAGDSGNDAEMMVGDTLGVVVGNFSEELAASRGGAPGVFCIPLPRWRSAGGHRALRFWQRLAGCNRNRERTNGGVANNAAALKRTMCDPLFASHGSELGEGDQPAFASYVLSFAFPPFDQGCGAGKKMAFGCAQPPARRVAASRWIHKEIIPMTRCLSVLAILALGLSPSLVSASPVIAEQLDLSRHIVGYLALGLFAVAYFLVVLEETIDLRKSKPIMCAAALIWVAIAIIYKQHGLSQVASEALRQDVLAYGELLLFLIVSIAYVNVMEERGLFDSLRAWLVNQGFDYRKLFWITGFLAFFISSISNNMTTAMLMCAVVMAVGKDSPRFVGVSCVNTVVAANAGGTFCPFGDITTLMVWQRGIVEFWTFLKLFVPALVNFVIPAAIMHFAVPKKKPKPLHAAVTMKRGAKRVVLLFLLAILTAVGFQNLLELPAAVGMMAGLTYLQLFSYFLHVTHREEPVFEVDVAATEVTDGGDLHIEDHRFDIFHQLARMEWDTLLFFYGVVLCVGGLGFIGYLGHLSDFLYGDLGPTPANVLVGLISSLIDNGTVMFAILSMKPDMSVGQWLLVTLTAGVGGSLLSVGSAAGVALMGQAKGIYTFMTHLKWLPAILLGYLASIGTHFLLNRALF